MEKGRFSFMSACLFFMLLLPWDVWAQQIIPEHIKMQIASKSCQDIGSAFDIYVSMFSGQSINLPLSETNQQSCWVVVVESRQEFFYLNIELPANYSIKFRVDDHDNYYTEQQAKSDGRSRLYWSIYNIQYTWQIITIYLQRQSNLSRTSEWLAISAHAIVR